MRRLSKRRRIGAALAAVLVTTGLAVAGTAYAGPAPVPAGSGRYLVMLADAPAATRGVAAAAPLRARLQQEQSRVARAAGVTPLARFTVASNGFAAALTPAQVTALRRTPGVLSVVPDVRRKLALFDTPRLLGLSGTGGVWDRAGGKAAAGKGIVVGVLDTGVWPENPMFAGEPVTATAPAGAGSAYRGPDGRIHVVKADGKEFVGTCQTGPQFPATTCNSKIVGARFFATGYLAGVPDNPFDDKEWLSPRDGDSHGSHTSSTAVGGEVASMTASGRTFGAGSGMAPAAKLAVYKVCWHAADPDNSGCDLADIMSAIDAAVADGVDVLNFSIGGSAQSGAGDPVQQAFFNAAAAGVFVAASAGNDGPSAATVDNASPWVTTVAATTAHRLDGTVKLGNGRLYKGDTFSTADLPAAGAVLSDAIAARGVLPDDARLCGPDTLDPAKAKGKVVVCDRGVNARVEKSAVVKKAGGVGMVLLNVEPTETDPDVHAVPTIHLPVTARAAIRAYVSGTRNPAIALLAGDKTGGAPTPIPVVAGFSSRGPFLPGNGNLLKPDIAAPGVGILAAVAPGRNDGDDYAMESGTSMSSPHVAGLAALIRGLHPGWPPMWVKSAMMTTAIDTRTEAGGPARDAFAQGAGFVNPRAFLTPGLVYDSGPGDWNAFIKGSGLPTGSPVPAIDPSNLNVSSIGVGAVIATKTVKRTVTAVDPGRYTASVYLPGFRTKVSPATVNLTRAGQKATFSVTFTRTTAAVNRYAFGYLTWHAATGGSTVRSPIAIQPRPLSAPGQATGGRTGTSYRVTPGATGKIRLGLTGLATGKVFRGRVAVGAANPTIQGDRANKVFKVVVPAGTTMVRFEALTGRKSQSAQLYLLDTVGHVYDNTAGPGAVQRLDRDNPIDGTYYVVLNGVKSPAGAPIDVTLRVFSFVKGARATMRATPNPVAGVQGRAATIRLTWPAARAGVPYLGIVNYSTGGRTFVGVG